jgi:NAD dependent epimerase/dehydratase family enzyme
MSWIHLEDLVGLMLLAVGNRTATGPFNGTAPEPVRNAEFTKALAQALHRPAILPVPRLGLRLMFGEFASSLTESQRVLPKAAESMGYRFEFPTLNSALENLVGRPAR